MISPLSSSGLMGSYKNRLYTVKYYRRPRFLWTTVYIVYNYTIYPLIGWSRALCKGPLTSCYQCLEDIFVTCVCVSRLAQEYTLWFMPGTLVSLGLLLSYSQHSCFVMMEAGCMNTHMSCLFYWLFRDVLQLIGYPIRRLQQII